MVFFGHNCFIKFFAGLLGEVIVGEDVDETGVRPWEKYANNDWL